MKVGLDMELEVERLYALVNGIAMHELLELERVDSERVIKTIKYHIGSICID